MKRLTLLLLFFAARSFAADKYAYVDPVSGNDGTGISSAIPATAAALPYQTIAGAESANRQNLTTLAGDFHFRLLAGGNSMATALSILSANWPGTSTSFRVIFEGFGTGVHDGTFATTNGYTLTQTGAGVDTFNHDDVHVVLRDFRLRQTNFGSNYQHNSSTGSVLIDRMLMDTADGPCARPSGGSGGASQQTTIQNSAFISRTGDALRVDSSNANNFLTVNNNTFYGNHATRPTVDIQSRQTLSWNYSANIGAGVAYSDSVTAGAEWTASTRNKNASDDTSGDATYQSIAAATGSGTRFTSLTANAENFDIGTASALKDLATDSSLTIDILSRSRSTPDIGAFEFQAAGGGTVINPIGHGGGGAARPVTFNRSAPAANDEQFLLRASR
jgi:hypothetical protein